MLKGGARQKSLRTTGIARVWIHGPGQDVDDLLYMLHVGLLAAVQILYVNTRETAGTSSRPRQVR